MNQYDFNKLIEKYLDGNCTPIEAFFVETWSAQFAGISSVAGSEKEDEESK